MSRRRALALSLAAITMTITLAVAARPAPAQRKAPGGSKVLLLSGGQREHHGYRDQALYLARALEDTGRYQAIIAEDAAILETPALARYDLIIVPADRRDPESKFTRGQQEALLDFVKSGHGYVSIHGGDNAASDWLPAWREMLGGLFSHQGLPDGKTRKGTYTVKIVDTSHPITRGLSDFELKDELYYQIQMQPDVKPLATVAFNGQDWPVAWTRQFGKGRVFHTPLGHRGWKDKDDDDPLRNPSLLKLIVQGVDWVAEGRGKS
ncbi:MAG TPA: ThuA domain-containing protein [Isosphaeraceae bacterium]|jgi:hypothetical protein|nr:ThuA domain-containing protein [Isosphaeraceae bacterium]